MRVLVVDDDAETRYVLVQALQDEGYAVTEAADGGIALALLAEWPPDLILLDLFMPNLDGWGFCGAYAQRPPPRAPVVLLTAATLSDTQMSQGRPLPDTAATVTKPFDLDELLAVVRRYATGEWAR
jgi:CheY-like chemotaxis protein